MLEACAYSFCYILVPLIDEIGTSSHSCWEMKWKKSTTNPKDFLLQRPLVGKSITNLPKFLHTQ